MELKRLPFAVVYGLLLAGAASAGPVNVNTADAKTLAAELDGVGPALAEAIVKDRTEKGKYEKAEDLLRVKGVGERIIERNRANILLADPAAPPR